MACSAGLMDLFLYLFLFYRLLHLHLYLLYSGLSCKCILPDLLGHHYQNPALHLKGHLDPGLVAAPTYLEFHLHLYLFLLQLILLSMFQIHIRYLTDSLYLYRNFGLNCIYLGMLLRNLCLILCRLIFHHCTSLLPYIFQKSKNLRSNQDQCCILYYSHISHSYFLRNLCLIHPDLSHYHCI